MLYKHKGIEMKKILAVVLATISINCLAQVYAPSGAPVVCLPKQIPTPNGIVVIIVCQ